MSRAKKEPGEPGTPSRRGRSAKGRLAGQGAARDFKPPKIEGVKQVDTVTMLLHGQRVQVRRFSTGGLPEKQAISSQYALGQGQGKVGAKRHR